MTQRVFNMSSLFYFICKTHWNPWTFIRKLMVAYLCLIVHLWINYEEQFINTYGYRIYANYMLYKYCNILIIAKYENQLFNIGNFLIKVHIHIKILFVVYSFFKFYFICFILVLLHIKHIFIYIYICMPSLLRKL